MPRTAEDIENYLLKLGRNYEKAENAPGTYILRSAAGTLIALKVATPIVAVNVAIGPAPKDEGHQLKLYRRLLELNATDLMYAAYGLEDGHVVLSAAHALDTFDDVELEATLADIDVALARHTAELAHVARG